jgi:hypothetical protein
MRPRYPLLWSFLALTATIALAGKATAEILNALLPDGLPGYDTDPGVTVATRLHPEQMPLGLRDGPLIASPRLDESVGYDSNALPGPYRRGSWQIVSAPSLALGTDWSRNAIGALVSAEDTRFLSLPAQGRTDATVSAGARLDVGGDQVSLAAAHVARHEDRGQFDTIASDRPVAFQVDDVRATYAATSGRWTIEPSIDVSNWTYDPTTILGFPADQSYRDRVVVQGGVTLRYELAPLRDFVLVLRALGQDYTRTPPGQASPDSVSYQVLGGVDYDDNAVWHWRLLLGGETRHFASPLYKTQNTLIAEAGVRWSPDGMTSVGATLSRETDDAAQEGVSGLTYTAARATIDHEFLRDLVVNAYAGWQREDYFQGGEQSGTSFGLGLTRVLNRSLRLVLSYDQTDLRGSRLIGGSAAAGYSRGAGLVTLRMGI